MVDLGGPFLLPSWFDFGATFIWAITGALIAARRGFDIAGMTALALVSATGGGLLRDGLFLGESPPLMLRTWVYIALVLVAAGAVNLAGARIQYIPYFERTIAVVDALGLGGFAVTGVQLSLAAGLSAPAAAFVGVVNAVGGGMLRDVMIGREPAVFKPGPPAAIAALGGCLLYLFLLQIGGYGGIVAGTISMLAVFLLRVAALRYGWRTVAPQGFDGASDGDAYPG